MKKLVLTLLAVICLMATTSCTKENSVEPNSNDTVYVEKPYVWNWQKTVELEWVNVYKFTLDQNQPGFYKLTIYQFYTADTTAYPTNPIPYNVSQIIKAKINNVRLFLKYTDSTDSTKIAVYRKNGSPYNELVNVDSSTIICNYKKVIYKK